MTQDHHHAHRHDHHDHNHEHAANQMLWPLLLTAGFAFIEAFGGWYSGSLALLGDAGHMFSDAAALGLAWLGAWFAQRPVSQRHSYGLMRAEVIVAMVNGLVMLVVIGFILYEAIQRLHTPQPVMGLQVTVIAFIGMVVNLLVAKNLHQHQHSINQRAALLHVLGDLLGSLAALVAGVTIYFTGWTAIDPLLSIFISLLILVSTIRLLAEVLHVLMEGVPNHLDITTVTKVMDALPKVHGVHSVHIWSLSSEISAISAHVVLNDLADWQEVLLGLRAKLHEQFDIDHITLQPELVGETHHHQTDCWLTSR